jgi:hypothetical protein
VAASANESVLAYLRDLSAHSDVASALTDALAPLGDVQVFSPDFAQYRYVAAASQGVVFAFAVGMALIGFRLDPELLGRALASGAEAASRAGADWAAFTLFRDDWPRPDLQFWARKAYVNARG